MTAGVFHPHRTALPDTSFPAVSEGNQVLSTNTAALPGLTVLGAASLTSSDLPVNAAPALAMPIPDRDAVANMRFIFRLPDGTFSDADASLTYTATLAGGGALPGWLTFDAASQSFYGKPPADAQYDI